MSVQDVGLIELEPEAVKVMLETGEAVLVDVRENDEYAKAHIADSILSPMSDFEVETWPRVPGKKVIITCLGGVRSAAVARKLLASGQGWAIHLKGGLNAWREAGLPVVAG